MGLTGFDGFVVATPTATHAEVLESLLSYERPIFVEKPMTADVVSARRLCSTAEGRLFVMDKWRYHPAIEAMRAEIVAARVGEVLAIRTTRWGWSNPHRDVNALWILAPHDLAIVLHLTGEIPPVVGAFPLSAREPHLGLTAQLRGKSGPSVTMDLGIASPEYQRRCVVVGTKATLELRGSYEERIFVRDGPPGDSEAIVRSIEVGRELPLLTELQQFLGFLSGGPPPMSSAREGLLIVERVAAIEAALKHWNI